MLQSTKERQHRVTFVLGSNYSSQTGDTGPTVYTQVPTKRNLELEISKPGAIKTKHDNPNMTPAAHLRLRHKTVQHQQAGEGGFKYTGR